PMRAVHEKLHQVRMPLRSKPRLCGRRVGLRGPCDKAHRVVLGNHRATGRGLPTEGSQTVCPPTHRDASACHHTEGNSVKAEAEDPNGEHAKGKRGNSITAHRQERAYGNVSSRKPPDRLSGSKRSRIGATEADGDHWQSEETQLGFIH